LATEIKHACIQSYQISESNLCMPHTIQINIVNTCDTAMTCLYRYSNLHHCTHKYLSTTYAFI